MKFGKNLKDMIEESNSEFADKFLKYKDLKKKLKSLPAVDGDNIEKLEAELSVSPVGQKFLANSLTPEQQSFVTMLNEELNKFNDFYIEKEEEYVMEIQKLEDQLAKLEDARAEDLNNMRLLFVKFHGKLVLLQNWGALNYAALVKILKKHDKNQALALRSPYLCGVLTQPFYSVEILQELVGRAEQACKLIEEKLSVVHGSEVQSERDQPQLIHLDLKLGDLMNEDSNLNASIMKQTEIALNMWNKVKSLSIPVPDEEAVRNKRAHSESSGSPSGSPKKQKLAAVSS